MTESGIVALMVGWFGGLVLTFGGWLLAFVLDSLFVLKLVPIFGSPIILAVPVFAIPLILNVSLGYVLMRDRPKVGKVMMYGGVMLSIVMPIVLIGPV